MRKHLLQNLAIGMGTVAIDSYRIARKRSREKFHAFEVTRSSTDIRTLSTLQNR